MKIILTCGYPASKFDAAHEMLTQAGLGQARPSRNGQLTPQALQQNILTHYEVDTTNPDAVSALRPGVLWQQTAADLLLGNLDQKNWGWADDSNFWLMDFWLQTDQQMRFLLIYCAPEYAAAKQLIDGTFDDRQIADILDNWVSFNSRLLSFYHAHSDRCLLVNQSALVTNHGMLLEALATRWQVDLDASAIVSTNATDDETRLAASLVRPLLKPFHASSSLYGELESSADVPGDNNAAEHSETWHSWVSFAAQAHTVRARLAEQEAALTAARNDLSAAWAGRSQQQAELTNKVNEIARLQARSDETAKENELLLVQLHQVQEALEEHLMKAQANARELESSRGELAKIQGDLKKSKDECVRTKADLAKKSDELTRLETTGTANGNAEQARYAEQLAKHQGELKRVTVELKSKTDDLASAKKTALDAGKENELMLLQLHQVQEELEHYYLKCQDLAGQDRRKNLIVSYWQHNQPSAISIDLRRDIDGDNWYQAEDDGRWAGPGTCSTLRVPSLQAGRYQIELEVVDAMDPEMLRGMQLSYNGLPIPFETNGADWPAMAIGWVEVADADDLLSTLQFQFPKTVSPTQRGEDDLRELAVRLRAVKISRI